VIADQLVEPVALFAVDGRGAGHGGPPLGRGTEAGLDAAPSRATGVPFPLHRSVNFGARPRGVPPPPGALTYVVRPTVAPLENEAESTVIPSHRRDFGH
jgi:hypothetical protein